jgi:hypothetical protein
MKNTFKGKVRRDEAFQLQILQFCILSSVSTLIAYIIEFDRLAIALAPLATLCVMLSCAAFDAMLEVIDEVLCYTDLGWLRIQCFAVNRQVARATSDLRRTQVKIICTGD